MSEKKKAIGKKDFSLDSLKDKFSTKTKYKADRFIDFGSRIPKSDRCTWTSSWTFKCFLGDILTLVKQQLF